MNLINLVENQIPVHVQSEEEKEKQIIAYNEISLLISKRLQSFLTFYFENHRRVHILSYILYGNTLYSCIKLPLCFSDAPKIVSFRSQVQVIFNAPIFPSVKREKFSLKKSKL